MRRLPRLSMARAVALLAFLLVGYFIFTAAGDILLSQRLNGDERRLQSEVAELQRHEQELLAIRDYLQSDEYIEGVARRLLGLVRPGETLVIVSSSVTPTPANTDPSGAGARPWWEQLYGPEQ